jgi:ATP-dependent Clp protease ATP-binding subunit ClpC
LPAVSNWLSKAAKDALQVAEDEARRRRQSIGTPHLLLGLLADPNGRPADALASMGIPLPQILGELAHSIGRASSKPARSRPQLSARTELVLNRALEDAQRRGRDQVHPEDILVALVADPEAKAGSILKRMRTSASV